MDNITSDKYEMELAKLVEQARRLGVQADMLAANSSVGSPFSATPCQLPVISAPAVR